MEAFPTPTIFVNSQGFGPSSYPERFVGVPFNPFIKNERLGRFGMGQRAFDTMPGGDKRKEGGDDYELVDTKLYSGNRGPRLSIRRNTRGGARGGAGNRLGFNRGGKGGALFGYLIKDAY